MASDDMTFMLNIMTIGSGIQVILRLLPQQIERLQYWYYWRESFMIHTTAIVLGDMIYIPSFMTIGSGIQVMLRLLPYEYERLWCRGCKKCAVEICSGSLSWRLVPAFKWYPHNLRGCSVGITERRDLWRHRWDGLRRHDTDTNFYEDWFRHSKIVRETHTDTDSKMIS
jgi:hypothetical protein